VVGVRFGRFTEQPVLAAVGPSAPGLAGPKSDIAGAVAGNGASIDGHQQPNILPGAAGERRQALASMPKFYFHRHDDDGVLGDTGKVFPDTEAARTYATGLARFEVSEAAKHGRMGLSHRIDVVDETGGVVTAMRFADAVEAGYLGSADAGQFQPRFIVQVCVRGR
jgi:hypothetical protein